MYKSLLQLLTGKSSGYTMFPEFNTFSHDLKEDDIVRTIRNILGTEDEYWAYYVIQICRANPDISFGDIQSGDNIVLDGRWLVIQCNAALVSDEYGAAMVRPVSDAIYTTTMDRVALANYDPSIHEFAIHFAGQAWVAPCRYSNDRLYVQWPEELGVRGALLCDDIQQSFALNLRLRYPVRSVILEAKSNDLVYQMLEATELTHAFFFADTEDEMLAVLVHALQLYSDKLNN